MHCRGGEPDRLSPAYGHLQRCRAGRGRRGLEGSQLPWRPPPPAVIPSARSSNTDVSLPGRTSLRASGRRTGHFFVCPVSERERGLSPRDQRVHAGPTRCGGPGGRGGRPGAGGVHGRTGTPVTRGVERRGMAEVLDGRTRTSGPSRGSRVAAEDASAPPPTRPPPSGSGGSGSSNHRSALRLDRAMIFTPLYHPLATTRLPHGPTSSLYALGLYKSGLCSSETHHTHA